MLVRRLPSPSVLFPHFTGPTIIEQSSSSITPYVDCWTTAKSDHYMTRPPTTQHYLNHLFIWFPSLVGWQNTLFRCRFLEHYATQWPPSGAKYLRDTFCVKDHLAWKQNCSEYKIKELKATENTAYPPHLSWFKCHKWASVHFTLILMCTAQS